jgi:hypothetical protein
MDNVGFIILRHVNDCASARLYLEAYASVRKFHPRNPVVIVDDNSDPCFLQYQDTSHLTNTTVIEAGLDFKGRGELLPYYYFWKHKPFKKAMIIHDSCMLQEPLTKEDLLSAPVKFVHHFNAHDFNKREEEVALIHTMRDSDELMRVYNSNAWRGCNGVQAVIELAFLEDIQERFNFFALMNHVTTREARMNVERIFAVACASLYPSIVDAPSMCGHRDHAQLTLHQYLKGTHRVSDKWYKLAIGR